MSPDGLRSGGAGGEVGVWAVVGYRHPLDTTRHHGMEGARSLDVRAAAVWPTRTGPPGDARCNGGVPVFGLL